MSQHNTSVIRLDDVPFTLAESRGFQLIVGGEPSVAGEVEAKCAAVLKSDFDSASALSKADSVVRIGRGGTLRAGLSNGTSVILRPYRRGGLMAPLLGSSFFAVPSRSFLSARPFRELILLNYLWNRQLPVTRPVAACAQWTVSRLLYRGVLVTEEIKDSANLLDLVYRARLGEIAKSDCELYCQQAAQHVGKVLRSGVFHSDLHLGNVIVSNAGKVNLVDFDKACWIESAEQLKLYITYTINRWIHSAVKHGVRDIAVDPFVDCLVAELSAA